MNKMTKGAIAGAAGIVLLLGGAGTFALWNDTASVNGGDIATGTLDLTVDSSAWYDASAEHTTPVLISNPAAFLTVPGDVLKYTSTVTVDATGNNLVAEFGYVYDEDGVQVLPTGVTATVAVYNHGGTTPITNPVTVTDGAQYDVVVTVTFDRNTSGQVSQNATISLGDLDLNLQQVRPVVP